jgi:hypothetical protein
MQKQTKKSTVSSVLAERRAQRKLVTPSKASVRYVKFTAEEMAYDPPETTDPTRWLYVGRGPAAFFAKPSKAVLAAAAKARRANRSLYEQASEILESDWKGTYGDLAAKVGSNPKAVGTIGACVKKYAEEHPKWNQDSVYSKRSHRVA